MLKHISRTNFTKINNNKFTIGNGQLTLGLPYNFSIVCQWIPRYFFIDEHASGILTICALSFQPVMKSLEARLKLIYEKKKNWLK